MHQFLRIKVELVCTGVVGVDGGDDLRLVVFEDLLAVPPEWDAHEWQLVCHDLDASLCAR